jgi:D-alanyl-D-alanine carboxypeptidase
MRFPSTGRRNVGQAVLLAMLLSSAACSDSDDGNRWQDAPAEIREVFSKAEYRDAVWALRVVDLDTGELIHDIDPGHPVLIGSVRKLFSVGVALDELGPDYRFRTGVFRQGGVDAAGSLNGDLILLASGDLAMGGRSNPDGSYAISNYDHNEANALGNASLTAPDPLAGFRSLAQQVAAAGIRRITGEVVIDDRLFEPFDFRGEFDVRPIFVNDDVVDVMIDHEGDRLQFDWRPRSAAFQVESNLHVGPAGSEFEIELDPEPPLCIGTTPCAGSVSGQLPLDYVPPLTGSYPLIRTFRITQPSEYARTVFVEALEQAGVSVAAPVVATNPVAVLPAAGSYGVQERVAELVSHPFADYARHIQKVSYNLGADTSLMLFGVARGVRTLAGALAVEREVLAADYGIAVDQLHFIDGSGGGDTRASSAAVTSMLAAMSKRANFPAYRDALPRLGIDGSLAFVTDFESDPALAGAKGQVHAKTGTYVEGSEQGALLRAQTLAGYVDTKSGRRLAFALAINDVGVISAVDEILPVFQDQGRIGAILWKLY